jgi:urease subunit gamma/beta
MRLTPTEFDRLTIFTAAELARRRLAKGWRLNHPEAMALISDEMHEAARGGASYEEVLAVGRGTLTEAQVLDGVPELIGTLKLECLFGDGMRVLHVERPIRASSGAGSASQSPIIGGLGGRSASGNNEAAGSDAKLLEPGS